MEKKREEKERERVREEERIRSGQESGVLESVEREERRGEKEDWEQPPSYGSVVRQ